MRTPKQFQSTPSARRATGSASRPHSQYPISIHALREEGDVSATKSPSPALYFNPRPPRGGRPVRTMRETPLDLFQSTPSARRATFQMNTKKPTIWDFNPRPPRGGRRFARAPAAISARNFNPRPPRGGRLFVYLRYSRSAFNFNPRPPRGGRLGGCKGRRSTPRFQSTPSARRATSQCRFCRSPG